MFIIDEKHKQGRRSIVASSSAQPTGTRTGHGAWRSAGTLARWQLRQTWRLLLLIGLGITAAVMLACIIPLYSAITLTSGLRTALVTNPADTYVNVTGQLTRPTLNADLARTQTVITQTATADLAGQVTGVPQLELFSGGLDFTAPQHDTTDSHGDNGLALIARDMQQVSAHVQLVSGRLPAAGHSQVEVALSEETAHFLNVQVGSSLAVAIPYYVVNFDLPGTSNQRQQTKKLTVPLLVTGIIRTQGSHDAFWQRQTLDAEQVMNEQNTGSNLDHHQYDVKALLPLSTWTTLLTPLQNTQGHMDTTLFFDLYQSWSYRLDPTRLEARQASTLATALQGFSDDIVANMPTDLDNDLQVTTPATALTQYNDHMAVTQVPTLILTLLIVGLLLFFVSLMAGLLVERQLAAVSVLRSRGASQTQIYTALLLQALGMALLAVLIGAPLALLLVARLVPYELGAQTQGALQLVTDHPWQALWQVRWQLLGTFAVALLAMAFALLRVTRFDVLALRREQARPTRAPFWQRFYLDLMAAIFAAASYGGSLYMINVVTLDPKLRVLLQAPLILVSSVFLLLAGVLLFMRLFPLLLRWLLSLGARERGITSVIGVGMIARAPQQALRMILLLTFALAFAVFSLVFSTSQEQHQHNVASYQVGSDISGAISGDVANSLSPAQLQQRYRQIPGVTAAAIGYITHYETLQDTTTNATQVKILAIDPATFVQATTWAEQDAATRQGQLNQLAHADAAAGTPALVDDQTARTFNLQLNQLFSLSDDQGNAWRFRVVGQVAQIPSVNDNAGVGIGQGGIIVDYQQLELAAKAAAANAHTDSPVKPNYVWLRTSENAAALAQVRQRVSQGELALNPLYDRRALLDSLSTDPLYRDFVGVLALGAVAPILLALVGNLLSSWWSARNRATSFVVLRALGSTTAQLARALLYEQGIIYVTALALGLLLGLLLSSLTLPELVFTSVSAQVGTVSEGINADVFAVQNVPPIHIAIPLSLVLIILALVVICAGAVWLMVRTVTRPVAGQSLRLNED